jgi:pimeloyl-ACP methyl ester carboxylesterase
MTWFVLVPGACHGGWWFEPVAEELHRGGHRADTVTLAGLDPDEPPTPAANLDTHIEQVMDLLTTRGDQAVLTGHSYGGSVITGAADQHPEQVTALLYLDAFVPRDGESCWSMTNDEQRQWYGEGSGTTGLGLDPLPFFDERARPHPLGSLMQKSRLTGRYLTVPRKQYAPAADPAWLPHSPFTATAARLRPDPDWTVTDLDCGHNVLADGPARIVELLRKLA